MLHSNTYALMWILTPLHYPHARHRLCRQRRFVELPLPDLIEHHRPTSPNYKPPLLSVHKGSPLPPLCKWKLAYMKAHTLDEHWRRGIYCSVPLLKGHRQPVTTISCDGKPHTKVFHFVSCSFTHVCSMHLMSYSVANNPVIGNSQSAPNNLVQYHN